MIDISTNKTGFAQLSYSLVCEPLMAYLKLDGFASDGIQWDKIAPADVKLGADGLVAINQKPVLYSGEASFLPNANCRNALDLLVQNTTPGYGKKIVDYNIQLQEINETTRTRTTYTGGTIVEADAGNAANLDDGQGNKAYKFTFTGREIAPF